MPKLVFLAFRTSEICGLSRQKYRQPVTYVHLLIVCISLFDHIQWSKGLEIETYNFRVLLLIKGFIS